MKTSTIGWLLLLTGIFFAVGRGAYRFYADYKYKAEIEYAWTLADKASTISQKSEYIDKFVGEFENTNLSGTNANFLFPTQSTKFEENLKAVKSLQGRLNLIKDMDENSFAYQTALQQITAQEQGEADAMLYCLQSCWTSRHFYTVWNPLFFWGFLVVQLALIFIGFSMIES